MVAKTDNVLHLEGLGDVEVKPNQPKEDPLARLMIEPKEHVELLPPKERLAIAFKNRKHDKVRFYLPTLAPRKYDSPLQKRLAKLEAEFETAGPLRQLRILRYAASLTLRLEEGRAKHVNRKTHKPFRGQREFFKRLAKAFKEEKNNESNEQDSSQEENVQADRGDSSS